MSRRVNLAMVDLTLTPYRIHFHRRIVRELAGVLLWSARLHDRDFLPWELDVPAELEIVSFDRGSSATGAARVAADLIKGRRITRWLREAAVDAVVLGGYADAARLQVLADCTRRGVPCFVFGDSNVRGDTAVGARRWLKRAALPPLLRRCAGVLTCGSLGVEFYRRYGVPPERLFLSPYEPDYDMFLHVAPAEVEIARQRFGLTPGRRRLLYVGRLSPEKRVDMLVQAFARVAERWPEWDVVIAGTGPEEQRLRSMAARIPGRVRWTGFLAPHELAGVYGACDVFVLPSDHEPWGVVVNEAVAAGLALVCSDAVGAAAELLQDGVNGWSFPAGDGHALDGALCRVMEGGFLAGAGAAGRERLASWRRRADPVVGLRAALASAGLVVEDRAECARGRM